MLARIGKVRRCEGKRRKVMVRNWIRRWLGIDDDQSMILLMMAKMDQRHTAKGKVSEVIDLRSRTAGDTVQ